MQSQFPITRHLAALLALISAAVAMTACGDTQEASNSSSAVEDSTIFDDITFDDMDDLDYGATMRDNTDYAIPVTYDKRFLEDAEVEVLASYYSAIQDQDADLFDECVAEFYIDYYLENAYGGLLNSDAYIAQQYDTFQDQLDGADVAFALITVTSCTEDETAEDSGITYLKDMCAKLIGEEECEASWDGCKLLTIEPTLTDGTDSFVGGEINLFIVQLDGSYYICA